MAKVSNETRLMVNLVRERAEKEVERVDLSTTHLLPEKAAFRRGVHFVLGKLEDIILELERR